MFATSKLELGDTLCYPLIFAALLLLVKHFAWGLVTKIMEKRRQKVIGDLDQVESDRKEVALLTNQRGATLKDSKQEATQILSTTKSNAEKTKGSIISRANQETAAIRKRVSKDVTQAKADALNEARDQVADISITTAEKVISEGLSAADQKDLVDQSIKRLND